MANGGVNEQDIKEKVAEALFFNQQPETSGYTWEDVIKELPATTKELRIKSNQIHSLYKEAGYLSPEEVKFCVDTEVCIERDAAQFILNNTRQQTAREIIGLAEEMMECIDTLGISSIDKLEKQWQELKSKYIGDKE